MAQLLICGVSSPFVVVSVERTIGVSCGLWIEVEWVVLLCPLSGKDGC